METGIWRPGSGLTIAREKAGNPGGAKVLQVASDPTVHAHAHSSRHARPAQQPDRAPSPFESLLENSSTEGPPPSPLSTDEKPARLETAQQQRPQDNCGDSKASPVNDNDLAATSDAARREKKVGQAANADAADLNAEIE